MTTFKLRLLAGLVAFATLLGHPPPGHADEQAASVSLFDEGNRLYEAGKYADACKKYEASLALDVSSMDTRGRLALCYEKIDRLASAWSSWRDVRTTAHRSGRKRAEDIAASHIATLEPRLAHLTFELVDPAPASVEVSLDGTAIPIDSFGTPVAVDKGAHELRAKAPGRVTWSTTITVGNGEARRVPIGPLVADAGASTSTSPRPAPPAKQLPPAVHVSSARRWYGVAALGAGALAFSVGTWAGLDALSQRDQARKIGCSADLSSCSPDALPAARASYSRANLSTGCFIAGSALAATGIVLWLIAPSARPERTAWHLEPQVGRSLAAVVLSGSF